MTRQSKFSIVEGFYGREYSFSQRIELCRALKPYGLSQYLYAPKSDAVLRRAWSEPASDTYLQELLQFRGQLASIGIDFGIGFSPFEVYLNYQDKRSALRAKLDQLKSLQLDFIGVLFDDMRGDVANLAQTQATILHDIQCWMPGTRIIACPTYYSLDPILDKVFGERPDNYLSDLGKLLDSAIDLFWTGDKVVSQSYSVDALSMVCEQLKRKVVIWDNYPVNDGAKMSRYLHLKGVAPLKEAQAFVKDRFANPMNQPALSALPLASFGACERPDYKEDCWVGRNASLFYSESLASVLCDFEPDLQKQGLDAMCDSRKAMIVSRLDGCVEPAANELIDWLNELYQFDPDCLTD